MPATMEPTADNLQAEITRHAEAARIQAQATYIERLCTYEKNGELTPDAYLEMDEALRVLGKDRSGVAADLTALREMRRLRKLYVSAEHHTRESNRIAAEGKAAKAAMDKAKAEMDKHRAAWADARSRQQCHGATVVELVRLESAHPWLKEIEE